MNPLRNLIRGVLHAAGADGGEGGGGGGAAGTVDNAGGGDTGAANGGADPAVEQLARDRGWSPREEWRGNPSHWIDAGEYVQRSEQMIPILRSNLRKSEGELAALRRQVQEQNARLAAATESIEVLTNISTEQSLNAAKEKRRELLRQRAEARKEGDTDAEIALEEQIEEVNSTITTLGAEETAPTPKGKRPAGRQPQQQEQPAGDPTQDPDYIAWTQANPWFGTDGRRTALATAIGSELRKDPANNGLQGRAFFDRITAEMNKFLGTQPRPSSKVESGGAGGGGGGDSTRTSTGKSYNDLPQDAKEACTKQAKLVVGEGRAFKDMASWQKHYTTMYFNS